MPNLFALSVFFCKLFVSLATVESLLSGKLCPTYHTYALDDLMFSRIDSLVPWDCHISGGVLEAPV